MGLLAMLATSLSAKAQEITITLNPGWNWISYPNAIAMEIGAAMGDFVPMEGDMLKSQAGYSSYSSGSWSGSFSQFTPGWGYMYYSTRTAPVLFVFSSPSTPAGALAVTTNEPVGITLTTATCGGTAVSNDGTPILMKGVCWATHPLPTTYDAYSENGNTSGAFTEELTELTPNTVYYVRAYAVSVKGVNYGVELSFTTGYTISVSCSPSEGGTVIGSGIYQEGQSCTLTATANTGYTFSNWTEKDAVISTDATYSFTVDADRALVANFELETPPVVTEGLMAYYPFSGNANDASGNGYHATACNNYQYGEGQLGQSIAVVGQGSTGSAGGHVLLPAYDFDISEGVTLSLWVKAEGLAVNDGEAYINFGNDIGANSDNRMYIMQFPTYIKFVYNEGVISIPYESSYTGTWVMYTLSCNPEGQLMAYVNGEVVGEVQVNYNAQWNTSLAALGRHWWYGGGTTSTRFIGSFDEVRIYNRPLTSAEVLSLYNNVETYHGYVDLGLPSGTLWATYNVGANTPEEYGDYFAWGETQPKSTYNWSTYQYCNGSYYTLTKYCSNFDYGYNGFVDNLTTLLPEDDAATVNWGVDWRMPIQAEWEELYNNTTCIWTTQNGVNGRLFTATNGNNLFLPAAGFRLGSILGNLGSDGEYWSSSLNTGTPYCAWYFYFYSGYYGAGVDFNRYYGRSVRAVRSSAKN